MLHHSPIIINFEIGKGIKYIENKIEREREKKGEISVEIVAVDDFFIVCMGKGSDPIFDMKRTTCNY